MNPYTLDGEIYIISNEWAYAVVNIKTPILDDLYPVKETLIKKYAEYLHRNNKEKSIRYIIDRLLIIWLMTERLNWETPDDYQIIYRTPEMICPLSQNGTLAIKFKRMIPDDLTM